jgi:NADH dehydrogenase/NADH:ubiquinone oxidoreductase subunit G
MTELTNKQAAYYDAKKKLEDLQKKSKTAKGRENSGIATQIKNAEKRWKETGEALKAAKAGPKKEKRAARRGKVPLKEIPLKEGVAKKLQKDRSKRSRTADSKATSENVVTDMRWANDPGSFDYPGVDTKDKGK